jgi:hypothetical protein
MLIKKKSLIVALVSGFVICLVLITTLVGYAVYLELKDDESRKAYQAQLYKANAKFYAKYIDIDRLGALTETSGALRGQPVVVGIVRNRGYKDISDMLMKVKFLDRDGAIIYEAVFHPQEPSLGSSSLTKVSIPYLSESSKSVIRPEGSLPFKRILAGCPREISAELEKGAPAQKSAGKWSGRLDYEILAVGF